MEQAIYFPMLLTILNRDLLLIKKNTFKLEKPYIELITITMKTIHLELKETKVYMKNHNMKIQETTRDDAFTVFLFLYKGYEEYHNYFNPRLRNKVQELLQFYLYKRCKEDANLKLIT